MARSDSKPHFRPVLFRFLADLSANNRRDWFEANRERYERAIQEPAQAFVSDFGPRLRQISTHFRADPRRTGGSLFRIYRDVRFSRDKSPYKTHVGIQFRHRQGKDVHAPGFYLHLEPGNVFAGAGIWHPDGAATRKIREAIVKRPERWRKALEDRAFRKSFTLAGESLKRPPRGFDPDHPLIEDLKRKDFIAVAPLSQKQATAGDFLERYVGLCRTASPLVRFLCEAVEVSF